MPDFLLFVVTYLLHSNLAYDGNAGIPTRVDNKMGALIYCSVLTICIPVGFSWAANPKLHIVREIRLHTPEPKKVLLNSVFL